MIKEEIIVKTKEEFYREMDKFELGIAFSREKHATGVVDRTQVYKITDYAPPVDTLVVNTEPGGVQFKCYSAGDIDSWGAIDVFVNGATSETEYKVGSMHNWKWADPKAAIEFLLEKVIKEQLSVSSTFSHDVENQSITVTYKVEVTIRLVEDEPEPQFEEGEKVLVWDDDKRHAWVRFFQGYDASCPCKYKTSLWCDGEGVAWWMHCAKICQVCEKVECECGSKFYEFKGGDPGLYGPEYNCPCYTLKLFPTFEEGEKVLVWNGSKKGATHHAQTFISSIVMDKQTYRYSYKTKNKKGVAWWENCAKICQKCEKEECECNPQFENDELVLVWMYNRESAELRYFKSFDPNARLPFECWGKGRTSLTHPSVSPSYRWKNCAKICQACEKEECECHTFKKGEKVLVWNDSNIKVVRVLHAYTPEATHKFQTKVVGEPHFVFWRYGAKICQVCEKEV